jgi:hypothetical protein
LRRGAGANRCASSTLLFKLQACRVTVVKVAADHGRLPEPRILRNGQFPESLRNILRAADNQLDRNSNRDYLDAEAYTDSRARGDKGTNVQDCCGVGIRRGLIDDRGNGA